MAGGSQRVEGVRALLLLAVTGASTFYAVAMATTFSLVKLAATNDVSASYRRRVLSAVVLGALVPVAAALVYAWKRRRASPGEGLRRASRVLAPLVVAGPFIPVLRADDSVDRFVRVTAMALLVVGLEYTVRLSLAELESMGPTRFAHVPYALKSVREWLVRRAPWVAGALALGYALYMSYFTVLNHRHFGTGTMDLGAYDSAFYYALHGHPFLTYAAMPDAKDWSMLASHAEFAMYLLLPFYAAYPHAETLLVLQSVAFASGAIPIYRMASRRVSRGAGLALAAAYLLYAPMHGANFYDVHFQPFGAVAALWAIDALDAGRWFWFVIAFIASLASREDMPLLFMAVGAYMILSGRRPGVGLAIGIVCFVDFVVIKFWLMPSVGTWWFSDLYKDLYPKGDQTYGGVIKTMLSNPVYTWGTLLKTEKIAYVLQILVPLAFLPVRGKWLWLSLIPGGLLAVLTTGNAPTIEIRFQYSCYFIALIFPAAVLALEEIMKKGPVHRRAALAAFAAGTVLMTVAWGAIPPRPKGFAAAFGLVNMKPLSEAERAKERDLRELAAMVPTTATLAVTDAELPHISDRPKCYTTRWGVDTADYILEASGGAFAEEAERARAAGKFVVIETRPGLTLMKRAM